MPFTIIIHRAVNAMGNSAQFFRNLGPLNIELSCVVVGGRSWRPCLAKGSSHQAGAHDSSNDLLDGNFFAAWHSRLTIADCQAFHFH